MKCIFAFFLLAALAACGTGFKNPTNSTVSSEIRERYGKLVVTKTKAPTSPVQVVPVDVLPVANQFGVLARFSVKADNFKDMNLRFGGTTSVRGAGLTTVIRDVEHPERTTEWPNREFFVDGSGLYDVQVQGIANHSGDIEITMDADIRYNNGWRHTFKVISTVAVQEETAAPVPSIQPPESVPPPPAPASRPAGNLKVQKNTVFSDRTELNPNGVVGSAAALVGSFIITSGSVGGDDITCITLADDVLSGALGQGFQNLRLQSAGPADRNLHYSFGTRIGQMVGTLGFGHEYYDFVPSPAIKLDAGDRIVINIYADTKSSGDFSLINSDEDGIVYPSAVVGIGRQTGEPVGGSMNFGLQRVYVAEHGSLAVLINFSTPAEQLVSAGATGVEVAIIRLQAGSGEDVVVSEQYLSALLTPRSLDGTFYNFRLVSGTVQVGPVSNLGHLPVAPFMTNLVVPWGTSLPIRVLADVNPNAASGSTGAFGFLPDYDPEQSGNQPSVVARGLTSGRVIPIRFGVTGDQPVLGNKITLFRPGDLNGDGSINIVDALMIETYLQNHNALVEPWQIKAADYNQDGVVDEEDVVLVQQADLEP